MSANKLQDGMSYPPRGLRCERAASYLGMSRAQFLALVDAGEMPPPKRKHGMRIWDRVELDAWFENFGDEPKASESEVNVHDLLRTERQQQ
jgi:predicted DNA-binding transcriptional regulator AlpA